MAKHIFTKAEDDVIITGTNNARGNKAIADELKLKASQVNGRVKTLRNKGMLPKVDNPKSKCLLYQLFILFLTINNEKC